MAAESNLITTAQMKKVREVDFVNQFTHNSIDKLFEILGVTRKIPVMEGTTLYTYSISGDLNEAPVEEGDVIPLSQYRTSKTPVKEIVLNKWRKGVSAEAIKKSGYDASVRDTDAALLKDVQKRVRANFFRFLGETSTSNTAEGADVQSAFANAWGKLQVAFENDSAEPVYFVNPEDIASYLGKAPITTQNAFGMKYIEDFLGLGTVVMSSLISRGEFIATAKENLVMYYLTMNGDIANAFDLTADETGLIGIKSGYQNEERAQIESLVMSGVEILVEYADGLVRGSITGA